MPSVTINHDDVALERAASMLRGQLGDRYTITAHETSHPTLRVSTSPLVYANVRVSHQADGTRFKVHGGGILVGRVINEYTIARRVAAALRQSSTAGV
jgi:hypothetical protein